MIRRKILGNLEYIRNTPPTCHSLFPSPLWKHQTDKIDNRKLEKVILERERKDKGVTFNNVDGYKSPHINLEEEKEFKCIYNYIKECMGLIIYASNYKPTLGIKSHYGWANINRKGDLNREHVHADGDWSATYYVKTHANCGNIRLHNPIVASLMADTYNLLNLGENNFKTALSTPESFFRNSFNLDSISFDPFEGTLLIFPSWFFHSVDQNKSEYPRISISCNIKIGIPKGKVNE
tara:strand:- start:30 stop:737 length:708 start_codon:yes stop_codon:yes gene_type:complete